MFNVRNTLKFNTSFNNHVYSVGKRSLFKFFGRPAAGQSAKGGDDKDSPKESNNRDKKSHEIRRIKVGIIGGGTAPLYTGLLLKQSIAVKSIRFINAESSQFADSLDANHIDTSARLKCFPKTKIAQALDEVDIVALMEERDVTADNKSFATKLTEAASYVRRTTEQLLEHNPDALVVVFIRPVTITLPMVSEIYDWAGFCDPNKLIGSIALYSMRLDVTTARFLDLNPEFISVPLAGGADASTLVPLLSRAKPFNEFSTVQVDTLLQSFRSTDYEVTMRDSRAPALSAAAASAKMILTVAAGLRGNTNATACAYVRSNVAPGCRYFTSNLQFGRQGVEKNLGLPKVSPVEVSLMDQAIPIINEYTQIAINAVRADRRVKLKIA